MRDVLYYLCHHIIVKTNPTNFHMTQDDGAALTDLDKAHKFAELDR